MHGLSKEMISCKTVRTDDEKIMKSSLWFILFASGFVLNDQDSLTYLYILFQIFLSIMVRSDASIWHVSSFWRQTVLFSGCVAIVIYVSDILDIQFALRIKLLFRRYHIRSNVGLFVSLFKDWSCIS